VALRRRILRFSLRKSSDCFRFSFGACFARKLAHQFGMFRRAGRAHYREPRRDDKSFFIKKTRSLRYQATTSFFAQNGINPDYCRI
ncbi:hypothetical protein ACET9B_19435, partial [Aeromonas veronii]